MADILITGGSGRLGRALHSLLPDAWAPKRSELDITNPQDCSRAASRHEISTVIHCAALVDSVASESNRDLAWKTNTEGARNLVRAFHGRRFVYISSEYIFDGEKGNYAEDDTPGPLNFYGLTKLCGEMIVREHPNTLIIRAGIRADGPWRFPKAFTDQWTSDCFVSELAPQIVEAALSDECGVLHIGGERRSIYELARTVSDVGPMTRAEFTGVRIPRDTSLDSSKWHSIKHESGRVLEQAV